MPAGATRSINTFRPAYAPTGKAAADHLPEGDEIRPDAETPRHAGLAGAEPGNHLVENQQRARSPATLRQRVQPGFALRQQSVIRRQRFDDRRRDLAAVRLENAIELAIVVQRRHQCLCRHRLGDALARGHGLAGEAAPGADQHRIGVAVIAAVEFQHARAAGGGARHAQRRHHRFSSRRHKSYLLRPWHLRGDPLRERQRVRLAAPVRPAVVQGFGDDGADFGIAMTEQQRTEALTEIDVGPAGDIGQGGAGSALHENRQAADRTKRAHGTLHAAGCDDERPRIQLGVVDHSATPSDRAWRAP